MFIKLVYNSNVQSHLNYCSIVWGLGSKTSINFIFIAQKKEIISIENGYVNYFYKKETGKIPCHTKGIFYKNGLLSIHNIIAKTYLVAMHIIFRKSYPNNVMAICQLNTNQRPSRHETFSFLRHLGLENQMLPYHTPALNLTIIRAKQLTQC